MISVKPATRRARRRGIMFAVLAITGLLIAGNQVSSNHVAMISHPQDVLALIQTAAQAVRS